MLKCNLALYKPADTYESVCAELQSAIDTTIRARESQSHQFNIYPDDDTDNIDDQYWTDRTYGGRDRYRGESRTYSRGSRQGYIGYRN